MSSSVRLFSGTKNSKIPETASKGALSTIQGLAFPWAVWVRSMTMPINTFVTASMILETIGKRNRNMPPQTQLSFRTSV